MKVWSTRSYPTTFLRSVVGTPKKHEGLPFFGRQSPFFTPRDVSFWKRRRGPNVSTLQSPYGGKAPGVLLLQETTQCPGGPRDVFVRKRHGDLAATLPHTSSVVISHRGSSWPHAHTPITFTSTSPRYLKPRKTTFLGSPWRFLKETPRGKLEPHGISEKFRGSPVVGAVWAAFRDFPISFIPHERSGFGEEPPEDVMGIRLDTLVCGIFRNAFHGSGDKETHSDPTPSSGSPTGSGRNRLGGKKRLHERLQGYKLPHGDPPFSVCEAGKSTGFPPEDPHLPFPLLHVYLSELMSGAQIPSG